MSRENDTNWWNRLATPAPSQFLSALSELREWFEKVASHPDFDEEVLYSVEEEDISRFSESQGRRARMKYVPLFFAFYEELSDGAELTQEFLENFAEDALGIKKQWETSAKSYYIKLMNMAYCFKDGFYLVFKRAAHKRSMGFLEDNAKIFGVNLDIKSAPANTSHSVGFSHDGLDFLMSPGRLNIHYEGGFIQVCVIEESPLPLGDYYSQLLGLVVARPEQVNVVGFAIELGKILNFADMTFYSRDYGTPSFGIYTPFNKKNEENEEFSNLMERLIEGGYIGNYTPGGKESDIDLGDDRGYMLKLIVEALKTHFGNYGGWF